VKSVITPAFREAFGLRRPGVIVWFWIGSHIDYERRLR